MDIIFAYENVSTLKPLFLLNIYNFIFSFVLTKSRTKNIVLKQNQKRNQAKKYETKPNRCLEIYERSMYL